MAGVLASASRWSRLNIIYFVSTGFAIGRERFCAVVFVNALIIS